jgi:hypothetical protein
MSSARADDSQFDDDGLIARTGTSVGYSDVSRSRWSTIGGHIAAGYRLGPFALEGEYERSKLLFYTGLTNRSIGDHKRFGASLRWYFARVARLSSGSTRLLLFGEAGAGLQRGSLEGIDFSRRDLSGGFGYLLDHKVRRSKNRLDSIGWHVGWRLTNSSRPNEAMARIVCGKHCPMDLPLPDTTDLGMTFSSSLSMSWD